MEKDWQKKSVTQEDEPVRLNKYLSDCGVCSRREADRMIEQGKVVVDGEAAVAGQKVLPTQQIMVDGKPVSREKERIVMLYHKPVGIECTTNPDVKANIIQAIGYEKRIYPIGRLDKNSEGLILLTNGGSLVNPMMKGASCHEKEYIVSVNKMITPEFLKKMSGGMYLAELDKSTRPCEIEQMGKHTFRIVLTQGLNRQIRRMCKECGYSVSRLKRVRVMNFQLGRLKCGQYRMANKQELETLLKLIGNEL